MPSFLQVHLAFVLSATGEFLTYQPWPGQHFSVFGTDINLYNDICNIY